MAESFSSKAFGLMFRKKLSRDSALLMVFEKPGKHSIWMPFMRFPIDIVFLDSRKRAVGLHERARPISFRKGTWRVYYPDKPAKYVIEMAAGMVKRKRIAAGDLLHFQGD